MHFVPRLYNQWLKALSAAFFFAKVKAELSLHLSTPDVNLALFSTNLISLTSTNTSDTKQGHR